jgi:predicted NUDIX family phosphoesterase
MALQQTATPITKSHDEHILVVKRNTLFKTQAAWTGLKKVNFDNYLAIINANKEFLPRSLMEQD